MSLDPREFFDRLDRSFPRAKFLIAYSGGLDSSVLLHLCALGASIDKKRLLALHVNHGLQTQSPDWAEHCVTTCAGLAVSCEVLTLKPFIEPGQSIEEAARIARYRALAGMMRPGHVLLTAQHREDQAESVLLQLLRGSGLPGLSGMPESIEFGAGILHRPLLPVSRKCIRSFADAKGLNWIEDPSNADRAHDRNFLRQEIIPQMLERWPAMHQNLARSAKHCAEAQQIIDRQVESWLRVVMDDAQDTVSIENLAQFDDGARRLILRHWIRTRGFRSPSTVKLREILREMLEAAPDRCPIVDWANAQIRRYRGKLYLLSSMKPFDSRRVIEWSIRNPLVIAELGGTLECEIAQDTGSLAEIPDIEVQVRFRNAGECCRIPGRQGSHTLKKIFQEKSIPPWERGRIPLVYWAGELAAVGSLIVCTPFHELGLQCKWTLKS